MQLLMAVPPSVLLSAQWYLLALRPPPLSPLHLVIGLFPARPSLPIGCDFNLVTLIPSTSTLSSRHARKDAWIDFPLLCWCAPSAPGSNTTTFVLIFGAHLTAQKGVLRQQSLLFGSPVSEIPSSCVSTSIVKAGHRDQIYAS